MAGESLGGGLIIDFSRDMRRITVSSDASRVDVQSGAILAEVNRALIPNGRWFGPDPATRSVKTMGSVLATNASGSHYLRSGSARDTVESMRVVTVQGELLDLSVHQTDEAGTPGRLARGIAEIQSQFQPLLDAAREAPKARGGYRLDDVVEIGRNTTHPRVDLAKFMVGTQGTLGIIVDATVRTEAIATHRGVVLSFYHRLDMAARSAVAALNHGLVACDLMDRRLLQIARDTDPRFAELLPREAEAMVLVEIQGESLGDLYDRLAIIRESMSSGHDAAFASLDTVRQSERDLYWQLSRRVIPRMYRFKGTESPVPFIEDVSVPRDRLPDFLTAVQDTLKKNHATATFFAHVGHGQLNLRPFLDLSKAEDRKRLHSLSKQIADVAWQFGGQVSVEHAAGLSRSYLLPDQFGDLWQAMGQVKRLFDPLHRLNPGKLFGAVLQKPNENLRPSDQTIEIAADNRVVVEADQPHLIEAAHAQGRSVPQLQVLQHWPANGMITSVARSCNGCGRCRTTSPGERQCPVFRATPREEASPRAKANLLRGVLSGQLSVDDLATEEAKEIADLCFNCHQCRLECPASVDIPKIVGELKAQYVATNGLPVSDLLMGRIETVAALASQIPWFSNLLIRGRFPRWIAEKLFGLSAARELPPVVRETFLRHASRRGWTRPLPQGGLKVLYFVDHYANYHDPDLGRALGEILQQNSIGIYVPLAQLGSGMARITSGDLKGREKSRDATFACSPTPCGKATP